MNGWEETDVGMLRECAEPRCSTRTLGEFCIDHEVRVPGAHPRPAASSWRWASPGARLAAATMTNELDPGLHMSTRPEEDHPLGVTSGDPDF